MLLEIGSITWVLAIILATHLENGNFTNITSKGLRMDQAATPWVEGLTIGQVLRTTAINFPDQVSVIFPALRPSGLWLSLYPIGDASC